MRVLTQINVCKLFFSLLFNQIFLQQGPELSMSNLTSKSGKNGTQDVARIHQGIR